MPLREVVEILREENRSLRERISYFELEDRKLREALLRRSGLGLTEKQIDHKEQEFKPIKKTILPWSQQAARLEADSKERYWKKEIELRERSQQDRKVSQEQEDYNKDMEELNNVSS